VFSVRAVPVALLVLLAVAPANAQDGVSCMGLTPGPVRTVIRVIDGETLALDDSTEVRLIGALAPRASDVGAEPGTWTPENATREQLANFVLGRSIEVAFGGERVDRYGRLQAQMFLLEQDQRRWIQRHLLEQGLARAYVLAGNRACARELVAAEDQARAAGRGLWAEAAYQVRRAERTRELSSYRATFQVIDGEVARVAFVRGVVYLNFARNWRQSFSVSLPGAARSLLGDFSGDLKGLEGRQVRVRGWIEGSPSAPAVDLAHTGHIELMAVAAGGAGQGR
jgi:micrococcal nuclease